jgi:RNA polymerase sigma factor (sigma-70 family)
MNATFPSESVSPATGEASRVSEVVEHLFRHEAGRMVAILTRIFGVDHLGLAEDVVQETLARALKTWPYYGVPSNPPAWIMRAARNLALDAVRREKVFRDKEPEIIRLMEGLGTGEWVGAAGDGELSDDRLRLMFVCCHPQIPAEAQVALALKTLCGFSEREISRAFLTSEAAIAKRLTRAKQRIREAGIAFEIPEGQAFWGRLDGVLRALYLLFNEGYKASVGDTLVRDDICREAIRLAGLLAEHPVGNASRTHALLALMLLSAARSASRVDVDGNLLRLRDQDRALWDQSMIARGMYHLAQSASGSDLSEYHLQAGIAACHCSAASYEATDWERVLMLYDRWMAIDASPVIALNRAVVVANLSGPRAGMAAVEAIEGRQKLESYYLLYAVLGELEARADDPLSAAGYFRKAMQLADLRSEQEFLARRFNECEAQLAAM